MILIASSGSITLETLECESPKCASVLYKILQNDHLRRSPEYFFKRAHIFIYEHIIYKIIRFWV